MENPLAKVRLADRIVRGSFLYGPQRLFVSRWGYMFAYKNHVAIYHALTISIVLLTISQYERLQAVCANDEAVGHVEDWIDELIDAKLLVCSKEDDSKIYKHIQTAMPPPCVSIMQLILADTCNLACKYCFIGRNAAEYDSKNNLQGGHLMSEAVADKAIDFFERQIARVPEYVQSPKDIIFYGGEPLLNFSTLRHVIRRVRWDQQNGRISQTVNFMLITNGTLLTSDVVAFLKKENVLVSLSLDGVDEVANDNRVDRIGRPVFGKVMEAIKQARSQGLNFGLSVTLTPHTLLQREELLKFLIDNGIESLSFNILLGKNTPEYNMSAGRFIIDFYKVARSKGIKEDRMLRKIKAFSRRSFYYHDCAALSGNQIVVLPDGSVGVCQGQIGEKAAAITHVNDLSADVGVSDVVKQWMARSPINMNEFRDCPAIGICGGGCPINARDVYGGFSRLDERFCVHTLTSLDFLIGDICEDMVPSGAL